MCLNRLVVPSIANQHLIVQGVGYKVYEKAKEGKENLFYMYGRYKIGKWYKSQPSGLLEYIPGFHIFLYLKDAEEFAKTNRDHQVYEVQFKNVSCMGVQYNNYSTVVAHDMKIVKKVSNIVWK